MTKLWWHPPQLRIGEDNEEERHATWLELFYDLVFVVAIAELAHNLSKDISLSGFISFVALFVPVWWSWLGSVFYATRFDTDDLGHRLLTAVQMVAIAAMAVNVHNGLGDTSVGFAVSYMIVRSIIIFQYLRAGYHILEARPLTTRFSLGFTFALIIWLVSIFVPIPWRFWLWALGLIVDMATPLSGGQLHSLLAPHYSHLPERLGLFTLIVLGESIAGVVRGIAEQNWNVSSSISGVCGLLIAFSLWWIYFDNVDGSAIIAARTGGKIGAYQIWLYAHLPLVIGLTASGVGVQHIVSSKIGHALPVAERWLICGGVALCLVALGIIHLTTGEPGTRQHRQMRAMYRVGATTTIFVLAVAGANLSPVILIVLIAVVCAVQLFLDLKGTIRLKS